MRPKANVLLMCILKKFQPMNKRLNLPPLLDGELIKIPIYAELEGYLQASYRKILCFELGVGAFG
jgi:hypothetical protein